MKKVVAYLIAVALALSWTILPGLSKRITVHAQEAAPELKHIGPEVVTAGAPQFTIRLEGRNFVAGANVLFDGQPLPQPRVSKKGKLLLAEVPESLVAAAGTHTIQAVNPDGMVSATIELEVVQQDPNVIIRLPQNSVQEDSGFTFLPEIRGEGFKESSKVFVWRKSVPVTLLSSDRLQFEVPDTFTNDPARVPVTLRNKDGGYSNTEIFFVVPRPPKIDSIDPDTIEIGTEDFLLKVFGNFKDDAVIVVNGQPLPTTHPREARLEATVPGSLRSAATQLIVRVEQDGIQSKDEILTVAPTDAPFIFAIAPNRIRVGENRATIDIVGANFSKASALLDGQDAKIRAMTRRRLTIVIPGDLLSAPGTHTIQVKDKDGNATDPVTFEVVPDVTVSTLVGRDRDGFNAETCVSADEALLRRPRRMAFGPDGLIYFTDQQNHAIRTVNRQTGEVCTIAGTGLDGYKDSNNPAGEAPAFSFPNGVAVGADGTVYVTENGNSVVRRIRRAGGQITVDTFAGTFVEIADRDRQKKLNSNRIGLAGFKSDEQLESSFRLPDDIVIAPDGTLYVADALNHAIRRIRNGVVETVAGNGVSGFADGIANNARFNTPTALALSDDGRFLFVADTSNNRIRRIDLLTSRVETVAGSGDVGLDDGPASDATFNAPIGLALDSDGVLYVSELNNHDIRRVDAQGNVNTLAGDGTPRFRDGVGLTARFNSPRGLLIDRQSGILYVADYENFRIRKIQLR
ncbi:MAG TPA: SMP-30/gluconolactonase/LRE family protein [Blastocatellia bacterium]|nr:SMP-30/gluconolactonase/LRE family protein [Blastocatellia bacterium]